MTGAGHRLCPVRGGSRSFDRDQALERAMRIFWRQGYEATSLSDLTGAMDINPPCVYAAFGDKERLFMAAIERYWTGAGSRVAVLDGAKTARAAVEDLLCRAANELPKRGVGCMLVTSAMNCSSPRVRNAVARYRKAAEAMLRKRIERGIREGELPAGSDAATLPHAVASNCALH